MVRKFFSCIFIVALGVAATATGAAAQETQGPGAVEVTVIPAGAAYVAAKEKAPSFGNYGFGSAVTFTLNRVIGIEGEVSSLLATTSDLQFGDLDNHTKAPNLLSYTGNVIISIPIADGVRPYAAGGIGGLTMFERPGVGVTKDTNFLTGNVGGGIKWYAPNNRWGIRGDYRFAATKSNDSAPMFFGHEARYIHRVYARVIINTAR